MLWKTRCDGKRILFSHQFDANKVAQMWLTAKLVKKTFQQMLEMVRENLPENCPNAERGMFNGRRSLGNLHKGHFWYRSG